jgi:hypothetical protein
MLYTPRLIPTADSSMSSVVRSRLTPITGIHFSKEVAENPVSGKFAAEFLGRARESLIV